VNPSDQVFSIKHQRPSINQDLPVTTGDYNPTSRLPGGLTEADLLAIVEGEPLPRERAALIQRTLAAEPALARELEAMKRDREVLRSLGNEAAPAGLMDAVGSALQPVFERQMLLGLAEGDPVSERPPVSMVLPKQTAFSKNRKLAMAAGLALVAVGVAFTAMTLNRGTPGVGPGPGPIARNDARSAMTPPPPITRSAPVETTREVAIAKEVPSARIADSAAIKRVEDLAPVGPPVPAADEPATEVASAAPSSSPVDPEVGPPPPASMDLGQALLLAADHRLVIRVIPADGRFDRVTERLVRAKGSWQYVGAAPQELASILDSHSGEPLPAGAYPEPTRLTSTHTVHDPVELPGPPAPADAPAVMPSSSVYVMNARMDEATLRTIEGTMRDIGAEVVFEEAPQALPLDEGPVTAPGAVVWWGNNSSNWASWDSVPVVIQR
jgi:hypothetical protein